MLRPSWGVSPHVLQLYPLLHSFASQGQSLTPQIRDDAGEGVGSTPCTQLPAATGCKSPEFPSPDFDSPWTSCPLLMGRIPVLLFETLPLYWEIWDVSASPKSTSQEADLILTSSQSITDPRRGLPQDTLIQSPLPNQGITASLLKCLPN